MADVGRPSKYQPEFCTRIVVECGKVGMSMNEAASHLGVHKSSLYEWADLYPDFSDAMKKAQAESLAWWEGKGRLSLDQEADAPKFNHVLWYMNMKNRHGWVDKQEITGKDGRDLLTGITDDQLEQRLAAIIANQKPED